MKEKKRKVHEMRNELKQTETITKKEGYESGKNMQ